MTPRSGRPKQDKDGERSLSKAEQKLAKPAKKGKYDYPGLVNRRGRKEWA